MAERNSDFISKDALNIIENFCMHIYSALLSSKHVAVQHFTQKLELKFFSLNFFFPTPIGA